MRFYGRVETPTEHETLQEWKDDRDNEWYDNDQILGKFFRLKHFVANDDWVKYSKLKEDAKRGSDDWW